MAVSALLSVAATNTERPTHLRPGASSAESLFPSFASEGMLRPLVHVTRSRLGQNVGMTRCSAVMMHEYLSRGRLEPTHSQSKHPEQAHAHFVETILLNLRVWIYSKIEQLSMYSCCLQ